MIKYSDKVGGKVYLSDYDYGYDEEDYHDDSDVEYPEPESIDDPWWMGARSDW